MPPGASEGARLAVRVQRDQAVLLAGDRDGCRLVRGVAALAQRFAEGVPPLARVALPAGAAGDGVRSLTLRHDLPGRRVDHQHFGGLGGRVHADDERTFCC